MRAIGELMRVAIGKVIVSDFATAGLLYQEPTSIDLFEFVSVALACPDMI